MSFIRLFVYDQNGTMGCTNPGGCYNTGRLDTSKPPGQQCLDPDPKAFFSLQDMLAYANAHGETIQQTTREQVNDLCSQTPTPPQNVNPSLTPPPMGQPVGGPTIIENTPQDYSGLQPIQQSAGGDEGILSALGYLWPVALVAFLAYQFTKKR